MESNIHDLKTLLMKMPSNISTLISGPPGIGKTDTCMQVAEATGRRFKVFLAATMDPTDLVGVPFPNEATGTTVFLPPQQLMELTYKAKDQSPMLVCFDDITTADDHVFAALFRLFQHREVANEPIRDNVQLVATGNRVMDRAAAKDLPTALNNRFWHVDLTVNHEDWRNWAIQNGIQPSFVGYISTRPDQLHKFDPSNVDRAFATPRSIAMASRMQEAIGLDSPLLHLAISGCVGEAWSVEYQAFVRNTEHLVKPEEIMKDPAKCRVPEREKIDVLHATISSLIYYVTKNPTVDNCVKSFLYAERIPHPDMGMVLVHSLLDNVVRPSKDPVFKGNILNHKNLSVLIQKNNYIING